MLIRQDWWRQENIDHRSLVTLSIKKQLEYFSVNFNDKTMEQLIQQRKVCLSLQNTTDFLNVYLVEILWVFLSPIQIIVFRPYIYIYRN